MTDKATYDLYWALSNLVIEIGVLRGVLDYQKAGSILDGLNPEMQVAFEALDAFDEPPSLFDDTTKAEQGSAA